MKRLEKSLLKELDRLEKEIQKHILSDKIDAKKIHEKKILKGFIIDTLNNLKKF